MPSLLHSSPCRVPIALGDRSYDIVIGSGLFSDAAVWQGLPRAATALIVSNPTVAGLYAGALRQALAPTTHASSRSSCPMAKRTKTGRR